MERTFGEYPTDVSDEEWDFCSPYLTLMSEDAPQREYPLRAVFNALRYMVRAGCPWRLLPNDLPPWWVVHQQAMRWIAAASFEAINAVRRAAHSTSAVRDLAIARMVAIP
jgi:transposase